ncbi:Panacea domain-containing protein [Rosistilla oblonga]|uniref:Antitoxin SocA-like Panacea domain-containing protein n=1 Tax=Rosistilla oblonga TaxID=2527990 RepID=A0A518IMI0_9BACT|nr:Panacea domain-containing protein [Rosistilla oblonga]QDV54299.1 hypothetical protein Mal33_02490 [Rosistilla oblonga]
MTPAEKSQRLIETASAALHAAPGHELNAVVLNKVLFYLDLATLRDQGEAVTGNSYIALRNGPVISKYPQRLIAKLESLGIARQDSRWDGAKPMVLEKCPTHFEYLSPDTMLLVSEVTDFFADSTSQAASDFSHKNPGWQIAWKHFRREGKPKAINLQIAMQQIVENDPWMETPLVDEAALLKAADDGLGDDW